MKPTPQLIIVADRGHLFAYRVSDTGSLEKTDSASIREGTEKLSDLVSDQAGAFPIPGSPGTGVAESLPKLAELEMRSFRKIRGKIIEILNREKPDHWGFATPSEINGAILDDLDEQYRATLQTNLRLHLTNSPPADVLAAFQKDYNE